ncbi:ATP-dependent zinc protease [bacterium]|nr:ATP-dependent zinc protease [bacterium]
MDDIVSKQIVGWREWVSLPELGIPVIKAKLDTGARTSVLHASFIEPLNKNQQQVRFCVHPLQHNNEKEVICTAKVTDYRRIVDSGGHPEMRFIIQTVLRIGDLSLPLELSLTDREQMRFRLLLGRTAIRDFLIVDPALSFTLEKPKSKKKKSYPAAKN